MRQGKWRRTGIALSVIWLLAGGYAGNSMGLHKGDFAVRQFRACVENSSNPGNAGGECLDQFDKDYTTAIKDHWWYGLALGIIPIPLAWILAYGLTGMRRRRA